MPAGLVWGDRRGRASYHLLLAPIRTHISPTAAVETSHAPCMGDWTDKAGQTTAHRYAASKYTLSLRAKRTVLSCAKSLEQYTSWEEIPPEVLRDIGGRSCRGGTPVGRSDLRRTSQPSASWLRKVAQAECSEGPSRMRLVAMPDICAPRSFATSGFAEASILLEQAAPEPVAESVSVTTAIVSLGLEASSAESRPCCLCSGS